MSTPESAKPAGAIARLLRLGPRTQADLVQGTGLSRMTVRDRLESMESIGLVSQASHTAETGGRPAKRFRIDGGFGRILVGDMGTSVVRAGMATMDGTLLATSSVELNAFDRPDRAFAELTSAFDRFATMDAAPIRAVALGVPVSVNPMTQRPQVDPRFAQWVDRDLHEPLRRFTTGPVIVRHDVDLMALAEQRLAHPETRMVMLVKVGMGIGCTVLNEGKPLIGEVGAAFEIGHMPRRVAHARGIERSRCIRGHDNCLETVAGGRAIANSLVWEGIGATSSMDIMNLAVAGNTSVREQLLATGREVGSAVAGLINMLNPGAVIVGGNLTAYSDQVFQGFRDTALEQSSHVIKDAVRIVPATLGQVGGLTGASLVALDELFDPDALEGLISAHEAS